MNAKEISDSTLESVTPADNDLMLIYDTSEGTTGKATIADIAPKVAENIDISTLPAVTPAADDVLMIRDTSAGTTGKATIADITQKGVLVSGLKLNMPLIQRISDEGGEVHFQNAENSAISDVILDVYQNTFRIFSFINKEAKVFTIDFEHKTTYWN